MRRSVKNQHLLSCRHSQVSFQSKYFTHQKSVMMMIQQLKCKSRWLNSQSMMIAKLKITIPSHVNSTHQPQNQHGFKNSKAMNNQTSTSNLQMTMRKTLLNLTMRKSSSLKVNWLAIMSHIHLPQRMFQNTQKTKLVKKSYLSCTQCSWIQALKYSQIKIKIA